MTLALTQSDFRDNLKKYLDQVNDEDETVYIARSNSRAVAIVSQEKMDWLERALKAKEGSYTFTAGKIFSQLTASLLLVWVYIILWSI